ncbi:MAG TPA: glucuronate isomerase [Bacteroidales bacterium]|nr:glucuronate isomerase [Bacteroidales bacterium]HOK98055.1 glucuronate isomerase [Bacteroidales bacterium]HPO64468.1 glucuronate isomerase [Bacteroidales bacterium]
MKKFLDENFLLHSSVAEYLYHEHAARMPIIDYHCHLNPQEIADDINFENLTQAWLSGDHYKWRAMRTNGVEEKYCTGDAPDREKFLKWAETVPYTIRNPLFHWTHLELKRYFGIDRLLNPTTAEEIYETASNLLRQKEYSVRNLLRKMRVEVVCTTDDPADTLEHHQKIKADGFEIRILPTWRPDAAMAVENPVTYNAYLDRLGMAAGVDIRTFNHLLEALHIRHNYFHENGCRLSDHGVETFYADEYTPAEIQAIFNKVRAGSVLSNAEISKFKSAMCYEFGLMDHARGWVQQWHVGPLRNNNTRMYRLLGPDKGFDSIGDARYGKALALFLDRLDQTNQLPKTILYNINPADNELIATMIGNFQDGWVPGKIQMGAAWWFLDQKEGIERQINALSNMGLLSRFVGMLTDSRSYLSYPRHEYFRRILCNVIGSEVEKGEIPFEKEWLGKMVENICYFNALHYFGFK